MKIFEQGLGSIRMKVRIERTQRAAGRDPDRITTWQSLERNIFHEVNFAYKMSTRQDFEGFLFVTFSFGKYLKRKSNDRNSAI